MRLPRRQFDEVSFQLAPMIDMTFLLLIFFMVTTRISKEQIRMEVRLPHASNAVIPHDISGRDLVTIDAAGALFTGNRPVSDKELASHLTERLREYPPLRVYVRADSATPAKRIKEIMKIAAEAGAIDVIFGSYTEK